MIARKLARSSFVRSAFILASGTTLAQVLPIVVTPIVSRMFSPSDFGVFGLFTAFIAVASVTLGLSFQLAIVSDIDEQESARLASLALGSVFPISTLCIGGLFILRATSTLGYEALSFVDVIFAWIALIAIGTFVTFRYWQIRDERFAKISRAAITQSMGRVVGQLGTGVLMLGGGGLIFAEALGRLFGVTALARPSLIRIRRLTTGTTRQEYLRTAIHHRKFPLISMPSSLLDSLGTALLIPMVAASYGLSISGQFSMGYRALMLPLAVISAAVADVFHVQLVQAAKRGMEHARRLFLIVAGGLLLIGMGPSILVILWGERLFEAILGDTWAQAGAIASQLMPWLLAAFAISPVSRVVLVFRGQEMKLVYDVVNIVFVIGVIQFGNHADWPIIETARALGFTQTIVYLIYFFLLWRILITDRKAAELQES